MKKIILSLLAFSFLTFMSCGKDDDETTTTQQQQPPQQEDVNPAKDFEGDYTLNGTITLNDLPALVESLLGSNTIPIENRDLSISLKGNNGDVTLVSGEYTYEGYVNASGLHLDPIIINYPVGTMTAVVTITVPVIDKPVNGTMSCTAVLQGSAGNFGVTGTVDMVAVRKAN